ncbi:hypothetical protein NL449_28285, partial [Klebsiella pneumoniae]|nr:hypothetical protein [Klebsiella pneumoniae]
ILCSFSTFKTKLLILFFIVILPSIQTLEEYCGSNKCGLSLQNLARSLFFREDGGKRICLHGLGIFPENL